MKGSGQRDLFNPLLIDFIDMSHVLVLLTGKINWDHFEKGVEAIRNFTLRAGDATSMKAE